MLTALDVALCGDGILQVARQGIELGFPELAIVLDPCGCIFHRPWEQAATMHSAVFVSRDEAGVFEHAQVLRYRGERHLVWRGEVADRSFALACEAGEDAAARGIGEGGEGGIEGRS